MKYKKILYDFQTNAFLIFVVVSYVLYGLTILGLSKNAPEYIDTLDKYIKIYICLYLIYRFNPIRVRFFGEKVKFTELDRKIVYSAALFILATTFINSLEMNFLGTIRGKFSRYAPSWGQGVDNNSITTASIHVS
jgi:hypothetical protein